MLTYLVTGGAGFIVSNFIHYMFMKYNNIKIINLDKLTYTGNINNLKNLQYNLSYVFVQADICDKDVVTKIFIQYDIDYVINFAAESHVDRSIINPELFVKTNICITKTIVDYINKNAVKPRPSQHFIIYI